MKNFKFKILSALILASSLVPTISVSAEEVNTKTLGTGVIRQELSETNKDKLQSIINSGEWKQYKDSIISEKDTIKKNYESNKALREEIKNKKATIENLRKDIKENNKQLTEEDLSKIKEQLQIVKTDTSNLTDLKGSIRNYSQTIKEDIKNKDFKDVLTQLNNIISSQNSRTEALKKVSADLDTLISIIQTAIEDAKTI